MLNHSASSSPKIFDKAGLWQEKDAEARLSLLPVAEILLEKQAQVERAIQENGSVMGYYATLKALAAICDKNTYEHEKAEYQTVMVMKDRQPANLFDERENFSGKVSLVKLLMYESVMTRRIPQVFQVRIVEMSDDKVFISTHRKPHRNVRDNSEGVKLVELEVDTKNRTVTFVDVSADNQRRSRENDRFGNRVAVPV